MAAGHRLAMVLAGGCRCVAQSGTLNCDYVPAGHQLALVLAGDPIRLPKGSVYVYVRGYVHLYMYVYLYVHAYSKLRFLHYRVSCRIQN